MPNLRRKLPILLAVFALAGCSRSQRAANHERKGKDLFAKKDYARAALEFKNAAQLNPRNPELFYQLGLSCLQLSDVACAVSSFRSATDRNPDHLDAQLKLASLYAYAKDEELLRDGEKRIRHVLKLYPQNAPAWQTFEVIEVRLHKANEAVAALQTAAQKLPGDVMISTALASAQYAAGRSSDAGHQLQEAVKAHPGSPDAAFAQAQFNLLTGSRAQALAELQQVLELDPKNTRALAALAALQSRSGQESEAESSYHRLATLDAQYKTIYANFLLSQGKLEAGLSELKKLAAANPEDRQIRGTLVAAEMQAGRTSDAERILANALQKNSHDADALLQRGELRLRSGKITEAEHDFVEVLDYDRRSANAHYDLSVVQYRCGNMAMQRNELTQALEIDPALLQARTALAQNLIASGVPQSALDTMDAAPEGQKATPLAVVARNAALMTLGRQEEARKNIALALRNSGTPELLLQQAQIDAASKDYKSARTVLQSLLKQSPDNEQALDLLAQTHVDEGQTNAALEALQPYAAQSWRAREVLGVWMVRSGKTVEARTAFQSAVAAGPEAFEAKIRLAQLDLQEGKLQAARQELSPVVTAHPENIPARLVLAQAAEVTGDSQTARQQYRAVLNLNKGNLEALNNLAFLLARAKSSDATVYAQEALAIAPDRVPVLETAAFAFYQRGMFKEAIADLEKAEAADPTPRRQYRLAVAYFAAGNFEKGRPILNAALQHDPQVARTEHDWVIPDSER